MCAKKRHEAGSQKTKGSKEVLARASREQCVCSFVLVVGQNATKKGGRGGRWKNNGGDVASRRVGCHPSRKNEEQRVRVLSLVAPVSSFSLFNWAIRAIFKRDS